MQRKHSAINPDFVLTHRSNQQLVDGARHLAGRHRIVTAHLVAHLAEIDARKIHVAEGYSYLGDYCVSVLGMSEDEGHRRAHAATLAQKYPVILDMLLEGSIHLSSLRVIGKCLTPQNHRKVLDAARGKSMAALEHLAARISPKPDVPPVLRKLPEPPLSLPEGESLGSLSHWERMQTCPPMGGAQVKGTAPLITKALGKQLRWRPSKSSFHLGPSRVCGHFLHAGMTFT